MNPNLDGTHFSFYDLNAKERSSDIDAFFPDWDGFRERIAIFSPHDDDGLLGAAYATLAAMAHGAIPYLFIFCAGNLGYSSTEMRDTIVHIRKRETAVAYGVLGIPAKHIFRFGYSDFGLYPFIGWRSGTNGKGLMNQVIPLMRCLEITRVLIPNPHREHLDHEIVSREGAYDAPQAGDPIVVDVGSPSKVRSVHIYSVWADFPPEDALTDGRSLDLRANQVIRVTEEVEKLVAKSLRAYASQIEIIEDLINMRGERSYNGGYIEAYLRFDPRPRLDFGPYKAALTTIDGMLRSGDDV